MLSKQFTRRQINTAIEVLSKSQLVLNWCRNEAKVYGVKEDTPEYERFVAEKSRQYARRIIR